MLFTRYAREGNWNFHEQISLAMQDYRAFLDRAGEKPQQELELDEGRWVAEIKKAITKRLEQGPLVIGG